MAYTMVHLEVAYRLIGRYEWIENAGDFMAGSVAPNAVHFHDAYSVRLKERSHLWNCGPRWGITLAPDKWKENILTFWEEHKTSQDRDFLAGYCVHLLTDRLNDLRIWSPFRKENMVGEQVEEIYHIYGKEAYGSDQWLYHNCGNSREIFRLLSEGRICPVEGLITQEDMIRQKTYILSEQYKEDGRTFPAAGRGTAYLKGEVRVSPGNHVLFQQVPQFPIASVFHDILHDIAF